MPDAGRDRTVLLTPEEWRVLLRHAARAQMDAEAVERIVDPSPGDGSEPDDEAAATLRTRLGRPRGGNDAL